MDGGLGDDTIYIDNAGDVVIEAAGQGGDRVYVNAAAYVLNAAAEVEVMVASAGALNLTGSDFANAITGNSLSNQLWGLSGNDQLTGDLGHDRLSGGLGNDIMTGGAGKDVFVFDTKLNKRTNVDRVEDFRYQDDSIYLENKIFTKLGSGTASKPKKFKADMFTTGTRAQDKEDRIVYDKKSGKLYYDQDGAGGKAQVQIATLSKNLKMTAADFFVI
jgi:Ca2+-binding RTX toxin-like protein